MSYLPITIIKSDFFSCDSCKINSLTPNRYCPCPRSSCEAKIIGTKIVTTEIIPATESITKDTPQNKLFKSLKSKQ